MKTLLIIFTLLLAGNVFAGHKCTGKNFEVNVSTNRNIEVQIYKNGRLIADVQNVSDLSAFDAHFVGNFNRSSFDLRISYNNSAVLRFDNFYPRSVKLTCKRN